MRQQTNPLSLYIHFPFCRRKCRYCDFYSLKPTADLISRWMCAVAGEWRHFLHSTGSSLRLATIFCGGGTPSLLTAGHWRTLFDLLDVRSHLALGYEWTIECNPESFSEEKAAAWLDSGVNRITFGIQSLQDAELRLLGRLHDAHQALAALHSPVLKQFRSVGVDVMYGLSRQTVGSLEGTLERLLAIDHISHLSAYELTIAPQTSFGRHAAGLHLPGEDATADMQDLLEVKLCAHGFEQYEISNYARHGHRCRHNLNCWHHLPYVGLGPAAHSWLPPQRRANVRSLQQYCLDREQGRESLEFSETIDSRKLAAEIIFLRLRLNEGLDECEFFALTGDVFQSPQRTPVLERLRECGLVEYQPPVWRLSGRGRMVADAVARELLE